MILDKENLFSNEQIVAGGGLNATYVSDNVIDMGAAGTPHQSVALAYKKATGAWKPLLIQVAGPGTGVDTGFAGSGGTSLQVIVQCDNAVGFGSAQTLYTSAAIAVASLVCGYRWLIDKLPPETAAIAADSRYFRISYVSAGTLVADAATSSCAVTAGFVGGLQTNFS